MKDTTETTGARGGIRYTGLPQEALRPARKGDPMPLGVLRDHTRRCGTCCETALCDDGETLVRVFESGRKYWRETV